MKRLLHSASLALFASATFAATECVVYSPVKSGSTLRLSTISSDPDADETSWSFPSSYTGHRAVCRLAEATTNDSFIAWIGGESYVPGDWMGVSTAMDYPAVGLTRTSAICNRIGIWSGRSDRADNWNQVLTDKCLTLPDVVSWIGGDESKRTWYREFLSSRVAPTKPPVINHPTRVRVVRYGIDDRYAYSVGVYGDQYEQRVILDKVFVPDGRNFLCEADLLGNGEFDLDWTFLRNEVVNASGVAQAGLVVSNMTYLVVIGDGPTSFRGPFGTNTSVNALSTMITRRFEVTHHAPVAKDVVLAEGARPTLRWSLPDEDPWAREYGTSYTAFRIQVLGADGTTSVFTSEVHRLPPQDANGIFTWTPKDDIGESVGRKWRVAMYNAKFLPVAMRSERWSNMAEFITAPSDDVTDDPQSVECVVYSRRKSKSPLHVSTISTNSSIRVRQWEFPSSYAGHRAVCRLYPASTNDSFAAWIGGESYVPGDWMGVSTAMDYPAIGLTRTSAICNRIGIWSGRSDRDDNWNQVLIDKCLTLPDVVSWIGGDDDKRTWYRDFLSSRVALAKPPVINSPTRVRVVRYGIDDRYCYSVGVYGDQFEQRVILDRVFYPDGRNFLCEADLLGDGEFDLDWTYLRDEVVNAFGVAQASLAVSNMTYLVVIGYGPTSFRGPFGTNTSVNALSTMITRRFEVTRHAPVAKDVVLAEGARPTLRWSIPDEDSWAKEYGTSYTAFRVKVFDADGTTSVFTSAVHRLPPQDANGIFTWTPKDDIGASVGRKWRVVTYNAKFKPSAKSFGEMWSNLAEFTE